ncbi:MAG: HypC/HybG/HupF family hydrogenase formation chaperone [Chloroflexi bacterium]|nr:HypC/HybG/HupF family hydrogenase formation chaperone [Chloroflexota bacterium]MCL5075446.1 HypC/HybG/HupF family hydrogenase formation chaperone [Chloroflexota bacterium]
MCLAIPMKVLAIEDDYRGQVEMGGLRRQVGLQLVPEVTVGDYVLVHAGYAIARIEESEALETLRLLEEMVALSG